MITSAYLFACLAAAVPMIIRVAAACLHKFGKALLAGMKESREREATHVIARHRDLIDPDAVIIFEPARTPEASAGQAADRHNDLLAFGQAIPFQSAVRISTPRITSRSWRGAQ
jgi:hypothetical protein